MKLAVYTDYVYRRVGDTIYAERAFALFVAELRPNTEKLRLIGRLAPGDGEGWYALPPGIELASLPYYTQSRRWACGAALARTVSRPRVAGLGRH